MKFKFEFPISHTTYISGMGISVAPHSLEGNLQKLLCQVGPGTCRTETFRNEIKWKWLEKRFWLNYDKSPAWMNLRHFWMVSCFLSQQSNEKTLKPRRSGETGRKLLSSVSLDQCILSVQVYVMTKIPHIPKAWAHSAWYQNRWTKGIYSFSG